MKQAVVIHPRFTVYGGGEMVALHVIKALQDLQYQVLLVTDNFNPAKAEMNFRMGSVMERCQLISIPQFRPVLSRFMTLQRLPYATKVMSAIRDLQPDISFSTQSAIYYTPKARTYHIVYDMTDLFEWPIAAFAAGPLASPWKRPYYRVIRRIASKDAKSSRMFVPLSHALERQLALYGYPHTSVLFPPCDVIFKVKPKKRRVVLVSRIAPQKNIQQFMRIAALVPKCPFVLVGTHAEDSPSYSKEVLRIKPPNVDYVPVRVRERAELVEESKVYLYTSLEPGIGIALGQAMGAGCIPITPAWGGGAEMLQHTDVGYTFRNINEATSLVQKALESEAARDAPEHIAEVSKIFSAENFERRIMRIVDDPRGSKLSPT